MPEHRVVVLGAGYAGLPAARRLANQVDARQVEITVINASELFVERPRLHQLATGQQLRTRPLSGFLGPSARLRVGRAREVDLGGQQVIIEEPDGTTSALPYHTLIYALGSATDLAAVPGLDRYAYSLNGPAQSDRLRGRLDELAAGGGGRVVVCGGGLTGVEAATEMAERYPRLGVTLLTRRPPGHWLSPRAQDHLGAALDRLGIEVRAGAQVRAVDRKAALLTDGTSLPVDTLLWAGGFTVPEVARRAGLAVQASGRVLVDQTLRSVSHPEVYAIGDAAAAIGPGGRALAMGCRTGGFTGPQAADIVAARLDGREPRPFRFRYFHECVSLGRSDALVQFLHADESPRTTVLTGRLAARYKDLVLDAANRMFGHPGPYRPRRRLRPTPAAAPIGHPDPVNP